MSEQYDSQSAANPESFRYGVAAVTIIGTSLRHNVDEMAASADRSVVVDIKTDPSGKTSPVTKYDRDTEQLLGSMYAGTKVHILGEEQTSGEPSGNVSLNLHVDPIDGTGLFINYLEDLIAWNQLPDNDRPARPLCGSMLSVGAFRPGSNTPEWGTIAAPFMHQDDIVRWTASTNEPAMRIEPDRSRHELPLANALSVPEAGGAILVASDSSEDAFGDALRTAGYRVLTYKSAVAAALSVMDPSLFERLRPGELGDDPVVGVVLHTAKNWDVAASVAIADNRGHFVSDVHGKPRTFEDGSSGAIFAVREAIGRTLVETVAPHLGK